MKHSATILPILCLALACTAETNLSEPERVPDASGTDATDGRDGQSPDDEVGVPDTGADAAPDTGADAAPDTAPPADAATPDADPPADTGDSQSWEAFCAGEGTNLCDGELAQVAFRFGLCSCERLLPQSGISVDAFNSAEGAYVPGGAGGSFGTNAHVRSVAETRVSGSIYAGGAQGFHSTGTLSVRHDLRSAGALDVIGGIDIEGDAYVRGDTTTRNRLRVAGTLYTPADAQVSASHPDAVELGDRVDQAVRVDPPCDCGENRLDVQAHVARFKNNNDNVIARVDEGQFRDLVGDQVVQLPCGRLFFDYVRIDGSLTLEISGRTAMYVDNVFQTTGVLNIVLADGAELDLFIGGDLVLTGGFRIGRPDVPAAARVYVAGDTVNFQGVTAISGNIAAPNATISFMSDTEIYGAVAARQFNLTGMLDIHHDLAVLAVGEDCGEPIAQERECKSCRECGNQACVDGTCAACRTDEDCCAPLVCDAGRCGLR